MLDSLTRAGIEPSQAVTPAPLTLEGLDLLAQLLAVARVREAEALAASDSRTSLPALTWHHGAAKATSLPAAAYDLITLQFVCHELPQSTSRAVLAEAARLLRPGRVIALVDQEPDSAVIRRLPAPIATHLNRSEPYLEDYIRLDLPAALQEAGFRKVQRSAADPRHRVLAASR